MPSTRHVAYFTPLCLTLGAIVLVHCTSNSPTKTHEDAGTGDAAGRSSSSSGSSSGTGSGSSNPCTVAGGACVAVGPGTCSGTIGTLSCAPGAGEECCVPASGDGGSGTGTGTGSDSGSCVGPMGGAPCDPGVVLCGGDAGCSVPATDCCIGSATTCVAAGSTCSGCEIACDETSDCPNGQICCFNIGDTSGNFTMTCQTGTCPAVGLASAQVCKTNAECPDGMCRLWNCEGPSSGWLNVVPGLITEACTNPSTFGCVAAQ